MNINLILLNIRMLLDIKELFINRIIEIFIQRERIWIMRRKEDEKQILEVENK